MKKEIRKEVREYILKEVNNTLTRLGVSENVVEVGEDYVMHYDMLYYDFKSSAIRQFPMMFKELFVDGEMYAVEVKDGDDYYVPGTQKMAVIVNLSYSYNYFNGGHNGCEIGDMMFLVDEKMSDDAIANWGVGTYIKKISGLSI